MVRMRNYRADAAALNREGVTPDEARELGEAIYQRFLGEGDPLVRRNLMLTAARNGDQRVLSALEEELRCAYEMMRDGSARVFQATLGLEGLGEEVFPRDVTSYGIDSYEVNAKMARRYLDDHGVSTPSR